jgi:thiol-disulfide isomerase/thioredoxin
VKDRAAILFFISPTCEPCAALAPRIETWANDLADRVDVIFISSGEKVANQKKFGSGAKLFLDEDRYFAKAVSARWTPSALLVGADRRIASHVAAGDVAITELAEKAIAQGPEDFAPILLSTERPVQHSVQVGERVPQFSVQAMTGEAVSTEELLGKQTMVVFWGTACPHCVAMAPDLKAWESTKNGDSPDLLVFSDGDLETNRALGLNSPIIIEPTREVAADLGMFGTPSAILVNENGRFASEVAVSAAQIWALVGYNPNK